MKKENRNVKIMFADLFLFSLKIPFFFFLSFCVLNFFYHPKLSNLTKKNKGERV